MTEKNYQYNQAVAYYDERKGNPAPLKNLVNIYIREGKIDHTENLLEDHYRLFPTETETRMMPYP